MPRRPLARSLVVPKSSLPSKRQRSTQSGAEPSLPFLRDALCVAVSAPRGFLPRASAGARGLAAVGNRTHLPGMILDLTHEETDALARLLSRTSTMTVTRCRRAFRL